MALAILVASVCFGLVLGSFLNVLVSRFPLFRSEGGNFAYGGRSRCDRCQQTLRWFELIPIVSFIVLRARCLRCGARIPFRYACVEGVLGALFGYIGYGFGYAGIVLGVPVAVLSDAPTLLALHGIAVYGSVFALLAIGIFDIAYRYIPDACTLGIACAGLIESYIRIALMQTETIAMLGAGTLGIGIFFFALWFFTRGKGMGFGDVKLAFAIPFLVGPFSGLAAMLLAFWMGAGAALFLIAVGRKAPKDTVPFGPFMVAGTYILMAFPNIAFSILFLR